MNDIAGRYRLLERLGSGNMGTVWRAFDERLRRTVAVKQVHVPAGLTGSQNDELVRRTMREGRIAARLQHPGLITVYDVVQDSGRPYLIMEHFPSKNLAALGTLRYPEAARIGTEAAEALAAAHASGVVHRDVKPANILVGTDGSVKITDFGISRVVEDLTATMTGMFAGTPAYLAPEVAKGDQATFASDVYSLGATLYTVIEGAPPAGSSNNPMGLLYRVASGDINPPKQAGPLTKLLTRLLSVDPAARPTMAETQLALATNAADQSAIKVIAAKTVTLPKSTATKTGKKDKGGATPASPEARAGSPAVPASDTASAPEPPSNTESTSRASELAAVSALAVASEPAGDPTPADAPASDSSEATSTPAAESSPTPAATANQPAESALATGSAPATASGPTAGASPATTLAGSNPTTGPAGGVSPATTPAESDPTTGPASASSALAASDSPAANPAPAASASSTTSPDPATTSAKPNPATEAASPAAAPAVASAEPTTSATPATAPDSAATSDPPAGAIPAAGSEPKPEPPMRKRLRAVAIGAGLVAVAVVAALVTVLVNTDDTPSNRDPAAADQNTNRAAPAVDGTTTTTKPTTTTTKPAPTTTTTEQPAQPPPSTQQPNPPSSATPAAAIADYYALMPGNRDQAWNRLTPKFQNSPAGGKSGYDRFWSKISSISATDIGQTGENVVEVTLLYTYNDGSRIQERHRYVLVNQNGTWLIDTVRVLSTSPA